MDPFTALGSVAVTAADALHNLKKSRQECDRLRAEVEALKAENARLHTANERMRAALERVRCRDWTPDWVRDIANRALEGGE